MPRMPISAKPTGRASWADRGNAAVAAGNLVQARKCFREAVKEDADNARNRFHLGIIQESLGNDAEAAEQLTIALRLDPKSNDAARRLAGLFGKGVVRGSPRLDHSGLIAALSFDAIDRDLVAAASVHHLTTLPPFSRLLAAGKTEGWDAVAQRVFLSPERTIFGNALLLELLQRGIIAHADFEQFLTALRKALLLHIPPDTWHDGALARFALALIQQCWLNEYVWSESEHETRQIESLALDDEALRAGDAMASHRLLLKCLYRPPAECLPPGIGESDLASVSPEPFRTMLADRLREDADIQQRGAALPSLSGLADDVSLKVAGQYEASPYPRWTSVPLYRPGKYLEHIQSQFAPGQLTFTRQPFEVLIAGCGTGRQAVSASFDYGSNARVFAFDITRKSLGYASLMADRMRARNLTLAHGDINRVAEFDPTFAKRFHVIECGGVLHHMADPFGAWRRLLECLAPGGIMLIGLYSRSARRNLEILRREPEYPGSSASNAALRAYRLQLMQRKGPWLGQECTRSRDFYSASGFRDYFLHVNEHTTTLPDIAGFLDDNTLDFRGFVGLPVEALQTLFPEEKSPGALARWSEWEAKYPDAFAGMYQFWCTRR